jgi:SAM-dependent methyltransferase
MSYFSKLSNSFRKRAFRLRHLGLGYKQFRELFFWSRYVKRCVRWYEGARDKRLGELPAPDVRETAYSLTENAIRTQCTARRELYLEHLLVPPDHFRGKKVLDVGCGPFPQVAVFTDCEAYGVDQLVNEYRKLGFPIDAWSERVHYIEAAAESIPVEDGFFDAVISVNAIDHVDDFAAVAREIARVLGPGGTLRFEAHYHPPTSEEPWELSDEIILDNYGRLGVKKLSERPCFEVTGLRQPGTLALWSSRDECAPVGGPALSRGAGSETGDAARGEGRGAWR